MFDKNLRAVTERRSRMGYLAPDFGPASRRALKKKAKKAARQAGQAHIRKEVATCMVGPPPKGMICVCEMCRSAGGSRRYTSRF